jgi:hypothetical protein
MKHQIGDLVEFKKFILRGSDFLVNRPCRLHLQRCRRRTHLLRPNSLGIILEIHDHKSLWEKDLTEDNNGYVWFSQEESKEYFVYENELVKE